METIEYLKARSSISKTDINHISEVLFKNIFITEFNQQTIKESEIFASTLIKALENVLFLSNNLSNRDKSDVIEVLNKLKFYEEYRRLEKLSFEDVISLRNAANHLGKKSQSAFES